MWSTYIPFLFTILHPDYINSNLYSYILSGYFLGAFLGIAIINTAVNRYFRGVLSGVSNNLNPVIIYLFFYAGTRSFKGRIFFSLPLFL